MIMKLKQYGAHCAVQPSAGTGSIQAAFMLGRVSIGGSRPTCPHGRDRATGFPLQRRHAGCGDVAGQAGGEMLSVRAVPGEGSQNLSVTTCDAASLARRLYKTQIVRHICAPARRLESSMKSNAVTSFELEMDWTAQTILPIEFRGQELQLEARAYQGTDPNFQALVLVHRDEACRRMSVPVVRVHSGCVTGDIFHSLRCDCYPQLQAAMDRITDQPARRPDLSALPGGSRHRPRQQDPRLCAAGPGLRHGRRQRRHRRPDRGARLRPGRAHPVRSRLSRDQAADQQSGQGRSVARGGRRRDRAAAADRQALAPQQALSGDQEGAHGAQAVRLVQAGRHCKGSGPVAAFLFCPLARAESIQTGVFYRLASRGAGGHNSQAGQSA